MPVQRNTLSPEAPIAFAAMQSEPLPSAPASAAAARILGLDDRGFRLLRLVNPMPGTAGVEQRSLTADTYDQVEIRPGLLLIQQGLSQARGVSICSTDSLFTDPSSKDLCLSCSIFSRMSRICSSSGALPVTCSYGMTGIAPSCYGSYTSCGFYRQIYVRSK